MLARIGEGGMGTVYLSHTRGGQPVALKVIRREYGQDTDFRRRFEQEVQAARRVQGYHVVPVVDHDTSGERPWLATQFVPGLALHDALNGFGPLPLPAVFQLIGCAAQALTAIHAAGVIHRDLKPSNILLGSGGPYVIDFGIARAADATQLTASGGMIGTPQYMSPEHALGEQLPPATDVFSLGLIAAVAATGRHPYGAGGALTVATQIANSAHRPPDLSGYPDELRPLLERMLAADPARRTTPAELVPLCEGAAGRPLRDFAGWLPPAVSAAIARSEQAAAAPPPRAAPAAPQHAPTVGSATAQSTPAGPPPGYVPTYRAPQGPPPPGSAGAYGAPQHGAPPHAARATGPGTPPPAGRGRGRAVLIAVALVVALGAGAGAAVWLTGGKDDGTKAGAQDDKVSPSPKPTPKPASGGTSGSGDTSGAATGGSSASPGTSYTVVFQDKPLTVRTPAGLDYTSVDLDTPTVDPTGHLRTSDEELEVRDDRVDFTRPMGKAAGTTPEECRAGARQNPLPSSEKGRAMAQDAVIAVGDAMCTVTSKGNVALWKITRITPDADPDHVPTYEGTLTLWKPGQ
ncbi:protein kinase [Streptomyces sp. NPDC048111]|uniref:protein kinase domain-containing protein n=1 Tax=Streptomyces sp. NPDC048111 TaxID=3365500 RepID=UPI003720CCBD